MWYVYFLELSNNSIYIGFSNNLKQRVTAHNDKRVPATAALLPAKLKSYIAVETREKAMSLEKYFKLGSGRAFAKKRFL
ncbi:MAG: excinuclease ABC subunit C [Verrucomicrobia bacterium CG_4_10_14_3_um_filter_43_23]|nr:MAG: excinuclease ABC subunit C [Verrucomicrobia bacterium CG1_02_43_26]PIP59235.1 MAG: excinuclease ABC subunit C [Verrucomicrobia bacterium CG22_combo_CG10-13_8_21_14_all_43_17]PIX58581.1 MAG: excinuclease ABC subunit C [Verrucomicrobia bacterium CG_4_10_14_3_um_filter_43_23]PIY61033.1 MAG: excinuclease ABC subunit C [Verrucomicrobia bacterium CG_4_10_14_0_8_um_filter_43_34]PJA43874.1 MAG: excinuclease ABC subunit C [Verrucomicrobia bacterium CG_4_9_14_3_um_filter_43_20]